LNEFKKSPRRTLFIINFVFAGVSWWMASCIQRWRRPRPFFPMDWPTNVRPFGVWRFPGCSFFPHIYIITIRRRRRNQVRLF
jgi:hypothetical protein